MKPKWTLHSLAYISHYLLLADPSLLSAPSLSPTPAYSGRTDKAKERRHWTAAVRHTAPSPGQLRLQTQNTLLCICMYVCVCASAWVWETARDRSSLLKLLFLVICGINPIISMLSDVRLFRAAWVLKTTSPMSPHVRTLPHRHLERLNCVQVDVNVSMKSTLATL